jgi:hypothetical protein
LHLNLFFAKGVSMTPKTAKRSKSPTPPDPVPPVPVDRWLSRQALRSEFHIHLPTMQLIRWMKVGKFPMRQKIDGHDRWRAAEIQAWLQQQG